MSVEIEASIPGIAEANAELERLMAADAPETDGKAAAATGESATTEEQRAAQAEIENAQNPTTTTNDTPAEAEKTKIQDPSSREKPSSKEETAKTGEPVLSRYEKAKQREQKGWEALNAEKAAHKAAAEKLAAERAEFDAKAKQSSDQFTPEQYEKAAEQFEASGKFDLAELAKAKAAELRKNPPAKVADEAKAKTEAARKEWTLKAGIDFPDLVKDKSALNARVQEMFKEEPDLAAHPKGIYLAARLASLEAAAAGVPGMEKELGQLREQVKKYEVLTAPGGSGGSAMQLPGVKTFEQKSDAEQLQELEAAAIAQGTLR